MFNAKVEVENVDATMKDFIASEFAQGNVVEHKINVDDMNRYLNYYKSSTITLNNHSTKKYFQNRNLLMNHFCKFRSRDSSHSNTSFSMQQESTGGTSNQGWRTEILFDNPFQNLNQLKCFNRFLSSNCSKVEGVK